MGTGTLRVGTSGYSYRDWVGPIYPTTLPSKEWLSYYAREFDAVEINSTYYRVPSPHMTAALVRKVDPTKFVFVVKVPGEMTHDRGKFDETVAPFLAGIEPLRDGGCLGALLAQFPYSLPREGEDAFGHLEKLRTAIPAEIPVHVEFRHAHWYRQEVYAFLRDHGLGFVNVDLPPLPNLPQEKTGIVTNGIGYFRFHGRNAAQWWQHATASQRYDYAYSNAELAEWVPTIERVARESRTTFVFMNNCHMGKSVRDAVKLLRQLHLRGPDYVPPWDATRDPLFG
ncbi:MAG: hypothetical protein BIP78_1010 [Candidatus Bipolaricaulis sibiricus]|uniref:DUF72 domain-containing protein n=1 Tax=Bipolaricaulis sibiricus TaxID=2501609 RepID=A0A410FUN4_BIPS1|nr:MAG: hypothetical protein BIP78_1010 [Candidatus Bipolaricaulis sibiricus]